MIILSNIKVTTTQPLFLAQNRKFLRFQQSNIIKKHPFPAKFINNHELQWQVQQPFPQTTLQKTILLQIFGRHDYGYNQQELVSILHGQLKIQKDTQFINIELREANNSRVAGFFSCRVKQKGDKVKTIIQTKIAQQQILFVKSIVAHIPSAVNKKIGCRLKVGRNQLNTPFLRSCTGDLVFTEAMVFHKNDLEVIGQVSIFQLSNQCEIKVGEGTINLVGAKPSKKVILVDSQGQSFGQAYIDCYQQFKQDSSRLKSSSLPNYLHKIKTSKISQMQNTVLSRLSPKLKRISVVTPNQSIVFSTSQRFKQTAQSERKTKYSLSQMRTSRLVNKQTHKPLQLFSIDQQIPGVGRYNLPSLWDRY